MSLVAVDFVPMATTDLEWVAAQDRLLYPFPWSAQNFADSMIAGYSCWIVFEGGERSGYAVLMMVLMRPTFSISVYAGAARVADWGASYCSTLGRWPAKRAAARSCLRCVHPTNPRLPCTARSALK